LIELLLQAERELNVGMVDSAERLFAQVLAADPRNGIAQVGLARVALERGDERKAYGLAAQALALDPQNAAAQRMVARFAEVFAARGEAVPSVPGGTVPAPGGTVPAPGETSPASGEMAPAPGPASLQREKATSAPRSRPGLLGRLLGRR
jgi:tetratricopeptide (TPR) repeat protein